MKEKPYILVVDDDPNIAKLEQLYLEKAGYEVKTVGRGDDAMTEFRKMPPDLMLLDVMMPGMDGWQVLKAVRKSSNIPIIMVTARDETFDKVLGLELGADDYITKPFDSKEMAARVKAVLRRTMGQTEEEEETADDTPAEFIRRETGLYLSDGKAYGGDGEHFLRMNIACPRPVLKDGLERLKSGVEIFVKIK